MLESSAPCRYFNSSPEVIHLVVMMYARYPLSLRNVEDLLAERGINISHETIRFWCNRFGPMFARKSFARRSDSTSGSRLAFVTSRLLAECGIAMSYETIRRWLKHFGPIISAELQSAVPSAQKFLSTHAAVYNTLNTQRHLTSAQAHRVLRTAMTTWREVVAAA